MAALHPFVPLATADDALGPGLSEMPPEIIDLIAQQLDTCSDMVACMRASPVFDGHHLLDLLARSFTGRIGYIIELGAPLDVVQGLYDRWPLILSVADMVYAARGGRTDVVRWMCESIAQAPGSWDFGCWPYPEVPIYPRQMSAPRSSTGVHMPHAETDFAFRVPWATDDDKRPPSPCPFLDTEAVDSDSRDHPSDTAGSRPVSPDMCYGSGDEMVGTCSRGGSRPASPDLGPSPDSLFEPMFTVYSPAGASFQGDTPSALAVSMREASCRGHVDVIRYLVDACPLIRPPSRLLMEHTIAEAARHGHQAVVAFAHERWTDQESAGTDGAKTCRCPSTIARAAIDAHQHDLLGWMHAVGCRSFEATPDALIDALSACDTAAVDALTRVLDPKNTQFAPEGNFARKFRAQAAASGESEQFVALSTMVWTGDPSFAIGACAIKIAANPSAVVPIALALSRGFTMAGAPQMFTAAASAGNLPLFKWAAGEAIDYGGERLAAPRGLPWNQPSAVLEAAFRNQLGVVQWLSQDPRCRSCLTPILARALLLADGMTDVLRWMHTSGMVPMHTWDALHAAVVHGWPTTLEEVADMGGVYTAEALVEAVRQGNGRMVAFLCERYGTRDAQAAIDGWMIDPNRRGGVDWIVRNVPGLDITQIVSALSMIDKPDDPFIEENCRLT
ncbi:hypothetical protein pclt_cds_627 [Pandoravirus celtis]|uniref:Ankyrin repeat domain containing protein n=1 Tax=Pandoravirus celtis TaxID=2568002 RepID=A0A4D6EHD7_9VIRU|nr:hypothetical protein pclt_cds_627 [Pandoravirus celtis]